MSEHLTFDAIVEESWRRWDAEDCGSLRSMAADFPRILESQHHCRQLILNEFVRHHENANDLAGDLIRLFPALAGPIREELALIDLFGPPITVLPSVTMPDGPAGTVINGRYRLEEHLSEGGFGIVWRATDLTVAEKEVAIKFLKHGLIDPKTSARFALEVKALSAFQHRNICTVHDVGVTKDGTSYAVMTLIKGRSLKDCITLGGVRPHGPASPPLPLIDVLRLMEDLARALHTIHTRGYLHRDIKPGNIMIDDEGQPVLLDFGLAKEQGGGAEALTGSWGIAGTFEYLAPELRKAPGTTPPLATPSSDLYSLGLVLRECLTGQTAPIAVTMTQDPPELRSPRSVNPRVPRDVNTVALVAIDPDPARRYTTAEAFAGDLRRVREGRPPLAKPAGPLVKLHRWAHRNRAIAASLTLTILILIGAVVVTMNLLGKSRAAEHAAIVQAARVAASRGAFAEAEARFEDAIAAGLDDAETLEVEQIKVLRGRRTPAEIERRIDGCLASVRAKANRSALLLLKAELALSDLERLEEGRRLLADAIAEGALPEEDRLYAEALGVTNAQEQMALLDALILRFRSHYGARLARTALLGMVGETKRAREDAREMAILFPDDVTPHVVTAIAHVIDGNEAAWNRTLDEVESRIGAERTHEIRQTLLQISKLLDLGAGALLPDVGKAVAPAAVIQFITRAKRVQPLLSVPVMDFVARRGKTILAAAPGSLPLFRKSAIRALEDGLRDYPDAALWTFLAGRRLEAIRSNATDDENRAVVASALPAIRAALESPSLFRGSRRFAQLGWLKFSPVAAPDGWAREFHLFVTESPPTTAEWERLGGLGAELLTEGDALLLFHSWAAAEPKSPRPWIQLARVHAVHQRTEAAKLCEERARAIVDARRNPIAPPPPVQGDG